MPLNFDFKFDYKNPDYKAVFNHRIDKLNWIRRNPESLIKINSFYKINAAQFITDWGCTYDPRNAADELPSVIPFLLYQDQEDWVNWVLDSIKNKRRGDTAKSRGVGMSWLSVALGCTLCLFNDDITISYGSRKESYVDEKGNLGSLFEKARKFLSCLPPEFRYGWNERKHSKLMNLTFPNTSSQMIGESGDGLGRGSRSLLQFVDESPWIPRSELLESSLVEATECRIDISTPRGVNNPFGDRVTKILSNGTEEQKKSVFLAHWRKDPRKDEDWYQRKCEQLHHDPVIIAQELDLNFYASIEGSIIPIEWVQAAVDAHKKLNIEITGANLAALDVADQGKDLNALVARKGILVNNAEVWTGKGQDIYATTERAILNCHLNKITKLIYDGEGLGAGVRGDSKNILEKNKISLEIVPFSASSAVIDPEHELVEGRKNIDFFANLKAQSWWLLRLRFLNTYRAVKEGLNFKEDEIISLSSEMKDLIQLTTEISQPTYKLNGLGKIVVDKKPDGVASPNLADALMMLFAPDDKINWEYFNA